MNVEMSEANRKEICGPITGDADTDAVAPAGGVSPYATGGGGVTFERKVAVQYLAHLLVGDGASELGDGRRVVSIAFQQAPDHPVDDLVVYAAGPEDRQPSLVLALGIRRSPRFVPSDQSTQGLVRQFVRALLTTSADGPEHRFGLVVAGPQPHAEQLARLADLAKDQMDASGFFDLVGTPNKFEASLRGRLDQLAKLLERALRDLGVDNADVAQVERRAWELLSRLSVLMPRIESPDEADWSGVANSLIPVARGSDLTAASALRDRLIALASEYSPKSARVDLKLLRRDVHAMLDSATRRHKQGWQALEHLHHRAVASVRDEITAGGGGRRARLDRSNAVAKLVATAADAPAVVASGESGVGKSALTVRGITAVCTAEPDSLQALCINLRNIPKLTVEFEAILGCPLSPILGELSAPQRMLIVDGADAVAEGMEDAFRYLVDAAQESEVKVIAVTSVDSIQVVRDILTERFGTDVTGHSVASLTDSEIEVIVRTFPELSKLNANARSRELLRRLVVADLLVRGRVRGVPLTEADAMREVWSGLVRRHEKSDRGDPDARDMALLRLADLDLTGGERFGVIREIDPAALHGLRHDGLLRTSPDDPFMIGPEFAHDEVRRYAVARLLLSGDTPASRILQAGAPRWSLSAARLACEAWLGWPDTTRTPISGRLGVLQASFDRLVDAGHGARWGDVPGEALLTLGNPGAVLGDAWSGLLADDAAGLRRLARLVDQRHRDENGIVDVTVVEPIISLLLDDDVPWRSGDHVQGLLRDWLRGHVVADTGSGHPLRILLRERIAEACAAAQRRLTEERAAAAAERAARTPEEVTKARRFVEGHPELFSEIGYGGRHRRPRPEVPREITRAIVLELLALLGPDLGDAGEEILRRVAQDAPDQLFPAVDELFAGKSLANYGRGLLANLTEAYYLDDEADGTGFDDDGVRDHRARSFGDVLGAWYRGPFMVLFETDFRNGVAVLNRLLNHAARTRARSLASPGALGPQFEDAACGLYETELEITGARRRYVGDEHVWYWYRGTGVGPYPCMSALQALERFCDHLIKIDTPLRTVVSILLHGCENLAMVGLVVGLLVRHLERADNLLDPYLAEPFVWHIEFSRVVNERNGFAAASEVLVAPERRKWSLREAAMFLCIQANEERAAELRTLGEKLVLNARREFASSDHDELAESDGTTSDSTEQRLMPVRAWASCLDRDRYQAHEASNRVYIQPTPPDEVLQALEPRNEELERVLEANRLVTRYIDPKKEGAQGIGHDELANDIATARELIENPPSLGGYDSWDTATLVAAAALGAHILDGANLDDEALSFAAETVLRIGEGEAWPRQFEFEDTFWEQGADRSAARALPLLFLPEAARVRAVVDKADGWTAFERAAGAGVNLARAVSNEVRLHLARGLDPVWKKPCTMDGRCHHEVGWRIVTETMRCCELGGWERTTGRRSLLALTDPIVESLARVDDRSILVSRLDAAIRALAPAAVADICVSTRVHDLLSALLAAQRRALLGYGRRDTDIRGTHTLVSARALLTLAQRGDEAAIYKHIGAYANNSALLSTLLQALSAAAEETPCRAATALRVWPHVIRHVLDLNRPDPFGDSHDGDVALAAAIPNAAYDGQYLYREVQESPIKWWEPLAMRSEVEAWIEAAAGTAKCVDRLVGFLRVLTPQDQVRTGLPWVSTLVLADPAGIASVTFRLPNWLEKTRAAAVDAGLSAMWQEVVDALVVAGVTLLAPYSE